MAKKRMRKTYQETSEICSRMKDEHRTATSS